ncbi:MAG: hypothetical protein U1C58_00520 [Flavobacteriaceae bacterium]|nr:hypothetical protein [Flavobacteriaceae bacterium]
MHKFCKFDKRLYKLLLIAVNGKGYKPRIEPAQSSLDGLSFINASLFFRKVIIFSLVTGTFKILQREVTAKGSIPPTTPLLLHGGF